MKKLEGIIESKIKPIIYDITFPNSKIGKYPIVIFCHGYKGFKNWGSWNLVAEKFAKSGFVFFKFNFSHNGGNIKTQIDFPDLKSFGKNTYSKEKEDLKKVIDWVSSSDFEFKETIDTSRIYLIGHSRGGGISILQSAIDKRVSKLATWASVSDYESRFPTGGDLSKWEKEGVYYVTNGRTKQQMPHFYSFYEDFQKNKEELNIQLATKKINIPFLIIHGDDDKSVGIQEAERLKKWNPKSKLEIINKSNHTFGSKHPWDDQDLPKGLRIVINKTINFFEN